MTLGFWLLLATGVLILFGVGQRVLDRLYLTDRQALFVIAAILLLPCWKCWTASRTMPSGITLWRFLWI